MSFTPRWYQTEAIDAGVKFLTESRGQNGLMVLPTGSGKSICIAGTIAKLGAPTLVFQPSKEILAQNAAKYRAYGYSCGIYSASAGEKRMADVTFATIGSVVRKQHLLERFKYVIVDECFPAGTLIDGRPIESIRPGYMVNSLNHKTGKVERRQVVRLFRNEVKGCMLVVNLTDGSSITCTENHPFFVVGKGYVPACELTTCSVLLKHGTTKATKELRELREGLPGNDTRTGNGVLLTGVCEGIQGKEQGLVGGVLPHLRKADDDTRVPENELQQDRKGLLQPGMHEESQVQRKAHHQKGVPGSVVEANEGAQSNVDARREGEDDRIEQGQDFPVAWRQRGAYQAPTDAAPCDRATHGARHRNGGGEGRASITSAPLQGGPCGPGGETCDRGGWQDAQTEEVAIPGPQEDNGLEFVGVASVEVYQRAGRGGDEEVREDHTVYNFEVEHNNNYFANGVLVHNCHFVNSEAGQYEEVLGNMGVPVLGMTATPYRLAQGMNPTTFQRYSILKFLTRTRPRIFDKVVYSVQNRVLFDEGYLAKLQYYSIKVINRNALQRNSTGADYTDESLRQQYAMNDMPGKVVKVVRRLMEIGRHQVLVFTRFTDEARAVVAMIPGAAMVTATTPDKERDRMTRMFGEGKIRVMVNVGIYTTGVDWPKLDAVVMARPTMSLALWYQVIGRCVRPHPDKEFAMIVDMGGNLEQFGKVEDLTLSDEGGWHIHGADGRVLTGVPFGDKPMPRLNKA